MALLRYSAMLSWLTWQRVSAEELQISRPKREVMTWVGYSIAYIGASIATGLVILAWPHPLSGTKFTDDVTYVLGFKLALLLVLPLLIAARQGVRPDDLLAGWTLKPRTVLTTALAFALGFSLNLGHLDNIQNACQGRAGMVALGALLPMMTAALPEEIVFRGLLHTRLERVYGRLVAWLGTAVLFTAWHIPTRYMLASGVEGQAGDIGSVLVGTGLPVLLVALVFGWAWDRWRNLPALVAAHWAIDLLPSVSSALGIQF